MRSLIGLIRNDRGATAAEYAMILALVGAAIALAAIALGESVSGSMEKSEFEIESCGGGGC